MTPVTLVTVSLTTTQYDMTTESPTGKDSEEGIHND